MLRSALLFLALTLSAAAEEPTPAVTPTPTEALPPKEEATLKSFGASHPQCSQWSDGCSVCSVLPVGVEHNGTISERDHVACSLPGIACQPADIACRAP